MNSQNLQQDEILVQRPSRFSLLGVIGILWSLHVFIAALFYPHFLLPHGNPKDPKDIQKEKLFVAFRLFIGTLILFFNVAAIIILFTRSNLIDFAKVFLMFITWIIISFIYIAFNHLRSIYNWLAILEDEAIQSRDQSVMLIRAGQAALKAGNNKLYQFAAAESSSFMDLLKKVGPLAMVILKKGNIQTIAFEALKLVFSGSRIVKYFF